MRRTLLEKRGLGVTITLVSERAWMADYLGARLEHGIDLLDTRNWTTGVEAAWAPGHHVSLHVLSGIDPSWLFSDPPWWTLPTDLLGRRVVVGDGAAIVDELDAAGPLHVKLSKHKYDRFTAAIRSSSDLRDAIAADPTLANHELLASGIVDIETEYRCWTIDGNVLEVCCYRDGEWSWGASDNVAPKPPQTVLDAAAEAGRLLGGGMAVDVATTAGGGCIVVETNPAWCSGFYGADPEVISSCLRASQGRGAVSHPFVPDAAVANRLALHPLLRGQSGAGEG